MATPGRLLTLLADDFESWEDTIKRLPGWTDDHTRQAYHDPRPTGARTADHCPGRKWLAIHVRSYARGLITVDGHRNPATVR